MSNKSDLGDGRVASFGTPMEILSAVSRVRARSGMGKRECPLPILADWADDNSGASPQAERDAKLVRYAANQGMNC